MTEWKSREEVVKLVKAKGYNLEKGMFYDDIYNNIILELIKENDELAGKLSDSHSEYSILALEYSELLLKPSLTYQEDVALKKENVELKKKMESKPFT